MRLKFGGLGLCLALVVGSASGCKTNNIEANDTTNNVYRIGSKGGIVGSAKSFGAFIPAGAVEEDHDFSVRVASEGEYPDLPNGVLGKVYSFEPHGIDFNTQVDVYLPAVNGSVAYNMLHAEPGGSWQALQGGISANDKVAHGKTMSFSFFVLQDGGNAIPDSGAGGRIEPTPPGSGGSLGTGNETGSGGAYVPMTGGTPGTGGSSNASCTANDAAPTGSTAASGQVANQQGKPVSFAPLDGFVVSGDMPGDLTFVFTEYAGACAVASGEGGRPRDQRVMPSGLANSNLVSASIITNGATSLMPGTYPILAMGQHLEVNLYNLDQMCRPAMQAPQKGMSDTIKIDEIDANHVVGSVSFADANAGTTFSGTFDFPFCPLVEGGPPPCCSP